MNENRPTQEASGDRVLDRRLADALGGAAPPCVEEAVEKHFQQAKADLASRSRPAVFGARSSVTRRVALAVGAALVVGLCWVAVETFRSPKITWAEVVDSFEGVPYFAATVFVVEKPFEPAERIEVWVAADGRVRVHQRGHVLFGDRDGHVVGFDMASGARFDPTQLDGPTLRDTGLSDALSILEVMASMEMLSLDNLLAHFSGRTALSTPSLNPNASISRDLQVFDITNERTPEWLRIWALRSTRLPVRVRLWDPRNGDVTEMLFEYMLEQPDDAFSPDAFDKVLRRKDGRLNKMHALLQDPGGRKLTPEDLFKENGFHMPTVAEAGRTPEGVFWVVSGNSRNRTPEGRTFEGFGKLTDDLGQEYLRRYLGHQVQGDTALEYFVPLNLGLDYRQPSQYTLTCWSQPDHYKEPAHEIGSVEVTEWTEEAAVPDRFGNAPGRERFLKNVIIEWEHRENWDTFDRLLGRIPGEPETDAMALFRECRRLNKLDLMGREDEAFALASRLVSVIQAAEGDEPWRHDRLLRVYVMGLLKQDRLDEAKATLQPYRTTFESAKKLDLPLMCLVDIVRHLEEAGTSRDAITDLFGFDALAKPEAAEQLAMLSSPGMAKPEDDPRFQPWFQYVARLSRYFESHPLPKEIAFLDDVEPFPADSPACPTPLPGAPEYTVLRLTDGWGPVAFSLAYEQGRDPDRVLIDPRIGDIKFSEVVVYDSALAYEDMLEKFLRHMNVEAREKTVRRVVSVARYDGRALPNWRDVRPPELGEDVVASGGGRSTTARSLLKGFERALKGGAGSVDVAGKNVVIVDETGLPFEPGDNQTWGSICLSRYYAFGRTPGSAEIVKDWFRDNFGITFHEEERDLTVLEIAPATAS